MPHTVFNIAHKIVSVWQITSLLNINFQFTMKKVAFKGNEGSKMSKSHFTNFLINFFLEFKFKLCIKVTQNIFTNFLFNPFFFLYSNGCIKILSKCNVEKAYFDGSLKQFSKIKFLKNWKIDHYFQISVTFENSAGENKLRIKLLFPEKE